MSQQAADTAESEPFQQEAEKASDLKPTHSDLTLSFKAPHPKGFVTSLRSITNWGLGV